MERSTRQRRAILDVLTEEERPLRPDEVPAFARRRRRQDDPDRRPLPDRQPVSRLIIVQSNGLTCAADGLEDNPITGHMTLTRSERCPLSSLAAEIL